MTPQSSFMVLAPLASDKVLSMRAVLSRMNRALGTADPLNPVCLFGKLPTLHFARFVILDDRTTGDIRRFYGVERPEPPIYLAFLGDFDGAYDDFMRDLVAVAGRGLREVFNLCESFSPSQDLGEWMRKHEVKSAVQYCNWIGRTVQQCREENDLHRALRTHVDTSGALFKAAPREIHRCLREFVGGEQSQGRLPLTPPRSTPFASRIAYAWDAFLLATVIVGGILTLPLTLLPLLAIVLYLRKLEKSDAEYAPRPESEWARQLAAIEDHGVTNQFSAMGSLKPGLFRKALLRMVLWLINLTTHVIFGKGCLARVHTIHFARWVYLDGGTRLFFASNYDGSLESYMDDFINKVAFGLNAVFSNGVGYPRTDWLVLKGAKNEQAFKYFIRRHELATEVWYNAHDGLTACNLERNSLIRQGLEKQSMADGELDRWLALI